ncbi:dephospho-CoA kinase [Tenacibaculum sp. SZ-18]|uniref:dephospho-CoA kinase n=1 Tax=Tenacibaculum sp. SZ-18 TaxID=754423 RepID=UPI000C2D3206|nr:dephospho-CoA kinase [Tenacibaculum sp. SZ-18]AUC15588.1 dephospho-CoA kinase [Tenacibaculum sp. SZ-18]
MLVGLTGGIGSGKSTVAKMLAEFDDVVVYFADEEAKSLMNTSQEIRTQLIAEFTDEVYKDGLLNRPFLAGIVFRNEKKLKKLNTIVHPIVHKHLQDFIKTHENKDYILYENAILFENGSNRFCDKIITVTAPEMLRIQRVIERDNSTFEEVKNRINNQWSEEKKVLQSNYVIHNVDLTVVKAVLGKIHNKLTKS